MEFFGDRLELAQRYAQILATTAVERGLLGPRETGRLWERHLLNCAVVEELIEPDERVVDVGSGAGLPGVVLAIARPDLRIDLVEPLLRRSTFLTDVAAELGLPVRVVRGRAEEDAVRRQVGGSGVVVSRAVAPLARLAGWCLPLTGPGGTVLAIKGASAVEEVARERGALRRLQTTQAEVIQCGAAVVQPSTTVVRFARRTRS